jgi:hypothetical protein
VEVGTGLHNGTANYGMRVFYCENASAGACTVLATPSSGTFNYGVLAIYEYSGLLTSSSLVGNAQQYHASPGATATTGDSGTLTAQPAMVFAAGLGWDLANTAIDGSYTSRGVASGTILLVGDKRVTATTAVSAGFTVPSADQTNPHFSMLAAFAESGGGGGGSTAVPRAMLLGAG